VSAYRHFHLHAQYYSVLRVHVFCKVVVMHSIKT